MPTHRGRPRGLALLVLPIAVVAALVLTPQPAQATWSIIAVDPETGLVGAAMASCIPASVLGDPDQALVPVVLVPGVAAGVAQGTIEPTVPPRMRELLGLGTGAEELVLGLTEDDEQALARQYAAAVVAGQGSEAVATFTGAEVEGASGAAARDDVGPARSERVAAAGVLLADAGAVDRAIDAYGTARSEGRSLDRALADALLVGSAAGGDRRCPDDQTALFAHLAVAEPDDDPLRPSLILTVTVDEGDGQNPVELLDRALDDGRTGWIDAGQRDPAGVPRAAVLAVGVLLTVAAVVVLRRGIGRPSARC